VASRVFGPAFPFRHLGGVVGDPGDPGAPEAHVAPCAPGEIVPLHEAALDQRDFPPVAALLAAPTPVPARLLAADRALLDERDLQAVLRQREGGGRADDAGADDDAIGALGRRCIALHGVDGG
jgi:hypothetical protein